MPVFLSVLISFTMQHSSESSNLPTLSDGMDDHLWYDDAGNLFVHDANGAWIPHPGYVKVSPILRSDVQQSLIIYRR